MKHTLLWSSLLTLFLSSGLNGQERFLEEVFSESDIVIQKDQAFGWNTDPFNGQEMYNVHLLDQAAVTAEHNEIRDAWLQSNNPLDIPSKYFTPNLVLPPADRTIIKLTVPKGVPGQPGYSPFGDFELLTYDLYMPNPAVDTMQARPVLIYIHTGNFIPKGINGGVTGNREDSTVVELCTQWAKRGYVAIAFNYRLGWNPDAAVPQSTRTRTLLNAVYRAIQDTKHMVRVVKAQAAAFRIDPGKIGLYGQGSGGYVALAYNSLDRWEETDLPKFDPTGTGITVIDTTFVGKPDGTGGLLNFYDYQLPPGIDPSIAICINAGGALGDLSWIEGNEAPFVTLHAVRDEFAPFVQGTVIVPSNNQPVVDADGPNLFMPKVNSFGLNDAFAGMNDFGDPYTQRARQVYGQTFSSSLPPINGVGPITVASDAEGLFVLDTELGDSAPWDFWDDDDFSDWYDLISPTFGSFMQPKQNIIDEANAGPNANDLQHVFAYIDSIQGYIHPKIMRVMQIGNWEALSINSVRKNELFKMYPNPAEDAVVIESKGKTLEEIVIMDISGKVVSRDQVWNQTMAINVKDLNSGVYFVKVRSNEEEFVEKLIIQ